MKGSGLKKVLDRDGVNVFGRRERFMKATGSIISQKGMGD
jgi:hypothetical protein